MKFNYKVKHNGVIYPAGTDVPVEGIEPEKPQKKVSVEPIKTVKAKVGSKRTKK